MDDIIQDFVSEVGESLQDLDTDLVRFERDPGDPDLLGRIFRIVHTVKGTSGFLGLMRLQTVAHSAENVLGGFRDGSVAVCEESVSAILQAVDTIRALVQALETGGQEPAGDDTGLIARLDGACRGPTASMATAPTGPVAKRPLIERLGGDSTLDAACEGLHGVLTRDSAFSDAMEQADLDWFHAAVRDALCAKARGQLGADALEAALAQYKVEGALARAVPWLRDSLLALEADPAAVEELLPLPPPVVVAPSAPEPPSTLMKTAEAPLEMATPTDKPAAQTIRVGVEALEHLMTVASELVLIRNQLIQTLREQPHSPFAPALNRLNQVTTELQESVMTARMQPISGAWAKLPRLVRDLAHDLGKEIELVMHGQDTELDRQVLELIKDPLTHMIRNAADHGLETPSERRAAGKTSVGRITLHARHEGGAILIEVADDGRGLPAEKIRRKAVAAGLISEAAAAKLSAVEVRQFIFAPGFSTAAAVTAVSGRGVGMDVVRTNIEQIGGAVELSSVEGGGTRFVIRIPLTLTIVSALIVECGGQRFAMPQVSVMELVRTSAGAPHDVEYIGAAAVLRLRDRLLPLVSLRAMLGFPPADPERERCIVVARLGAFTFGVIVDRVFDMEEIVVKPVSKILRHLKVYSGATILGDGTVIMILDMKGIAMQTGALSDAAGRAEPEKPVDLAPEPTQSVLVFRAIGGALSAAPLGEVKRIEKIDHERLERAGEHAVIQYHGRLIPVVADTAATAPDAFDGRRPMLVFARADRLVGLLVQEIIDVVDITPPADHGAQGHAVSGSMIVAGAATALIDVDLCCRSALGEPAERMTSPPRVASADVASGPIVAPTPQGVGRRLLVIDRSPFSRVLLEPLLSQARYAVTMAADATAALALHEGGQDFDLIMADTNVGGADLRAFVTSFARCTRWHTVPMLGLGLYHAPEAKGFNGGPLLHALSCALDEEEIAA